MSDVHLKVNGRTVTVAISGHPALDEVLREGLGLSSVRNDFTTGLTGASLVMLGEYAVLSALVPARAAAGRAILTAEGLHAHPLARALRDRGLDQLAAAPALLVAGAALLAANSRPTDEDIRRALTAIRCDGTGFAPVLAAVTEAARHGDRITELSQ